MKRALWVLVVFLCVPAVVWGVEIQNLGTATTTTSVPWIGNGGAPSAFNFSASANYTLEEIRFYIAGRQGSGREFTVEIFNQTGVLPHQRISTHRPQFNLSLANGYYYARGYNDTEQKTILYAGQAYWVVFGTPNNGSDFYRPGNSGTSHNRGKYCSAGSPGYQQDANLCTTWSNFGTSIETVNIALFGTVCGTECAPESPPGAPSFVDPTPANGSRNNTQITINLTSETPGVGFYLWFDTNEDPTTAVLSNSSSGVYTTSVPASTQMYYYKAGSWNSSGFSPNTTARAWTFDGVAPGITVNPSNEFTTSNVSARNPYDGTVYLNLTFSDDADLYALSVNITRSGTVYFNHTNDTLTGTQANYTASVNASGWPAGRYTVEVLASDAHTAEEIRPYTVSSLARGVRFDTAEGHRVEVEADTAANAAAVRARDRYEFTFTYPDNEVRARVFHVRSLSPIVYRPDSEYKAHFVIGGARGGNWLDFEGIAGEPVVTRVSDFYYTVRFPAVPPVARFRSIGGLNVFGANYSLYVGNVSLLVLPNAFIGEALTFGFNVSGDDNITGVTANLTYNGTTYPVSGSLSGSVYVFSTVLQAPLTGGNNTYVWSAAVAQSDGSVFSVSANGTHTVEEWAVLECSGGPVFVNWSQYDEDNPETLLSGSFAVGLTYWVGNRSNAKEYNRSFTGGSSWGLCFTPATGSFTADVYGQNTHPDSFTHRFYMQNATYTNSTTYYRVYNANASNDALYSDLKITTRYVSTYGYYKDVYAQLLRRYVGEGVYRTVQYDKSGDFGLLFFDIKEQSQDYKLRYYDENNSLLLETGSLKFICTASACELTQLLDPSQAAASDASVNAGYTYDNDTGVLLVSWSVQDVTSDTVTVTVSKPTFTGVTEVCTQTGEGLSGSLSCNLTGYSGEVFVSVAGESGAEVGFYVPLSRSDIADYLDGGTQALLTFVLMATVIFFGIFSPVGVVIMSVLSLVVVWFLGIFGGLTITFIVIAAVVGFVISVKVRQ